MKCNNLHLSFEQADRGQRLTIQGPEDDMVKAYARSKLPYEKKNNAHVLNVGDEGEAVWHLNARVIGRTKHAGNKIRALEQVNRFIGHLVGRQWDDGLELHRYNGAVDYGFDIKASVSPADLPPSQLESVVSQRMAVMALGLVTKMRASR